VLTDSAPADGMSDGVPVMVANGQLDGLPVTAANGRLDDLPVAVANGRLDGLPVAVANVALDGAPDTPADSQSEGLPVTVADVALNGVPVAIANDQLGGLPVTVADGAPVPVADVALDGVPGRAADSPHGAPADRSPERAAPAATKSIKVGWRVRRWLPPGTTEVRLDPGRRAAAVLAVVLVLGAAIAGFAVWRSRPVTETVPAALPAALPAPAGESQAPATTELVVSVAGLVARPGLVRLPAGARVADAVAAAGGPVPGTDLTGLNLARRLTDGEHVVVGPAPAAAGPAGQGASPSGSGARVDLNAATLADLDALPGIGPVTAQRILDWRAAHGRFTTVDQLREIEGIGEARLTRLRDLVTA